MPGVWPAATSVTTVRTPKITTLQLPGPSGAVNAQPISAVPRASTTKPPARLLKGASEPGPEAGNPREAPRSGA